MNRVVVAHGIGSPTLETLKMESLLVRALGLEYRSIAC